MAATTTEGTGLGSVDKAKPLIKNGIVRTENIEDKTIQAADLDESSVSTDKLSNGAITTAKLASGAVTAGKMKIFQSTNQTGTGSAQNIAHGLGAAPSIVIVYPVDLTAATVGQYAVTEGTHTTTNIVVTVTTGKVYKVVAIV